MFKRHSFESWWAKTTQAIHRYADLQCVREALSAFVGALRLMTLGDSVITLIGVWTQLLYFSLIHRKFVHGQRRRHPTSLQNAKALS